MKSPALSVRLAVPLCVALAALSACGKQAATDAAAPAEATKGDGTIALTAAQVANLGIGTEAARVADATPVGTVPGVVSLPPDARVAVTTPYAGTVVKVAVIQGQDVRQGDVLAVVRASEAVQYGAALARSQAELPVASANAARMNQLAREGIIAPARADEARAALRATEATVAENRRLLAIGSAGRDGTITLRAPISGRVASVTVDTGAPVGNGAAPFIVENVAALRLDLQVPERLAGQVRQGMTIHVEQDGRVVEGTVLSVAQSLDPMTRSLAAKASLPAGSGFVPGKGVMVTIAGPAHGGGVSVPASSVAHIESGDIVFVREVKGFRPVKVTVAGQIGDRTFLTSGLAAGAVVATSGVAELKSMSQGQ
ncbi:RND family efflux transporter MFP subunit [Novosphingobium nitrogenifigens DSM 19370]|uniref:RND family efflux transporter MFP subunit n=1 Tax=Novosphingobium nitrogenifigens DSM 19370 TaxID=983920 RepID=F1ZAS1_9SPHN|nr:efflux RND transporter periplasmic adaptor subunit [Novosphingobium nitrogenifigens]EGD58292.1 RND family efflux transporter MFP subunit [Novosphingobium nitrogenifigens DSM 19370]